MILKDELAKMAEREREAAREELVKTMSRERQQARKEAEKAKELVHKHTHTPTSSSQCLSLLDTTSQSNHCT